MTADVVRAARGLLATWFALQVDNLQGYYMSIELSHHQVSSHEMFLVVKQLHTRLDVIPCVALTPDWFGMQELAPAMDYMNVQTGTHVGLNAKEQARRIRIVQQHEIAFVSNATFVAKNAAEQIFSEPLDLSPAQCSAEFADGLPKSNLPIYMSRLCEAVLLKQPQETSLFRRMNFLRYQADIQRSLLNGSSISGSRLLLINQLLALGNWHRDRIVEANTRLVLSIVKKYINDNNRFDDLLSDGLVALFRAVEKFDYGKGFRFSTYATMVLRRNAYHEVVNGQARRLKMATGLQDMDTSVVDDQHSPTIGENRWLTLRCCLAGLLENLNRREKFIIRARFSLGSHRRVYTLQELASRLGISKERVRQLEQRGLEKLRLMASKVELCELEG